MTAVPKQKRLFTNRWGVVKAPEPSELQIQIALVHRLRLQCRPGILWYHCPNGELRDARHGAKLKAMGTLAGVADLQFVFPVPKPNLFLELKAKGRGLTFEQMVFRDLVYHLGHTYRWCDTLDDAIDILISYGVLPDGRVPPR